MHLQNLLHLYSLLLTTLPRDKLTLRLESASLWLSRDRRRIQQVLLLRGKSLLLMQW